MAIIRHREFRLIAHTRSVNKYINNLTDQLRKLSAIQADHLPFTPLDRSQRSYACSGLIKVFPAIKMIRPEEHAIAIVPSLTLDIAGRYSGGIQRIFLPFHVIQDLLECREYPDQDGVPVGSRPGSQAMQPKSVTR